MKNEGNSVDGGSAENDLDQSTLSKHVHKSVEATVALRVRAEQEAGTHQLAIESFTESLGQVRVLYTIIAVIVLWLTVNLVLPRFGTRAFDPPPFYSLMAVINVCALLFATMVLITQNRQGKHAEQREHLNLQMNLLSEQKIAKLIALVEELRRDLPSVHDRHDPEAEAMQESVDPHLGVSMMEKRFDESLPNTLADESDRKS